MRICIPLFLLWAASSCAAEQHAKNVILFLGDAAGLPVVSLAGIYAGRPQQLFIQRMPDIGLMDTSSASSWVTDSAAGMTAIMTGHKTNNGVVSQSDAAVRGKKDGEPLKTILEYAEERGLSTGVISNGGVTGATPAVCYAHNNDRNHGMEIAAELLKPRFEDGVDVVIVPTDQAEEVFRGKGYSVAKSLEQISPHARRAVVMLEPGRFELGTAVSRAIDILSRNRKGFFLMVEMDAHTNNLKLGLDHVLTLDRVIQETAERLKGDTLIVFAADHSFDTRLRGGRRGEPILAANDGVTAVPAKVNVRVDNGHTGEDVLVAAQGPGAGKVHGFFPNTQLFHIMMAAFGWE